MPHLSATYRTLFTLLPLAVPTAVVAAVQSPDESTPRPAAIRGANADAPALADWTMLADLTLASPVILRGTVARVQRLSGRAAADVPADEVRLLLSVDLAQVLRAPGLLPARAEWLWQGKRPPTGRMPIAKGYDVLAFLSAPMAGPKPEVMQFRLIAPEGQRRWSAAEEAAARAILAEARGSPALMVTGVSDGFRTEGNVDGASESQFFLATDGGRPLTLVVTRRPDAAPAVRVATGDLITASAAPVSRQTLLWRALACGMPEQLPQRLAGDAGLAADYSLAREGFGACGRRAVTVPAGSTG